MSSAIAGYYLGFFLGKGMVMRRVQNWTLNKRAFNSFHDNIMLFAVGHMGHSTDVGTVKTKMLT